MKKKTIQIKLDTVAESCFLNTRYKMVRECDHLRGKNKFLNVLFPSPANNVNFFMCTSARIVGKRKVLC